MTFESKHGLLQSLVHISEAPAIIGVAEKTLRNWRTKRLYPQIFVKLGGKVFINLEELENVVTRQVEKSVHEAKRLGLYV